MELSEKKTILITGAGGKLGSRLLKAIIDSREYSLQVVTSKQSKIAALTKQSDPVNCFGWDDVNAGVINWGQVDYVIHCAFAVEDGNPATLATSLARTREIACRAAEHASPAFVNISSRGVYGVSANCPATESSPVAPDSLYAMAKYGAEQIVNAAYAGRSASHTHLRLGAVIGEEMDKRVVSKLVKRVIGGESLEILGGQQKFQFVDIQDIVDAIVKLIRSPEITWRPVFNVGSNQGLTLMEIARAVQRVGMRLFDRRVNIDVEPADMAQDYGMSCDLFMQTLAWKPRCGLDATILRLFDHYSRKA